MENSVNKKEYTLVICDDKKDHAERLCEMINKSFHNFNVIICSETRVLFDYITNQEIDAVLLDIELDEADSIEVSKKLKSIQPKLKIIFISGYPEYIHDIFEVDPSFFLLKPVTMEKLHKALQSAFFRFESKKESLEIVNKGNVTLVDYEDIIFIESIKRIVKVRCINDITFQMYQKLAELEKIMPGKFIRCHQSYIVNLDHVKSFNINNFELKSNDVIPISQRKAKITRDYFYKYLKNKH